jgi:putative transposase
MVKGPEEYPYSSYRANALGEADAAVRRHALFARLGLSEEAQRDAYRALFQGKLDEEFVQNLRAATNGGWAVGEGRPSEAKWDKRQLNLL